MRVLFATFFNPDNIGARSLAAFLRQGGHAVKILQIKKLASAAVFPPPKETGWYVYHEGYVKTDFLIPTLTRREAELIPEAVGSFRPDILCYSGMSTLDGKFPEYAAYLRRAAPNAPLVAGGPGPTLSPELYLDNGADYVIRGEGEYALQKFAETYAQGGDISEVPNLCSKTGGALRLNRMAPLAPDLDVFPLPILPDSCYDHIANGRLQRNKYLREDSVYVIMASRGCIGHCSYCAAPTLRRLHGEACAPKIRKRNISGVLKEAEYAKAAGATGILFADDFFIRPRGELLEFFHNYKQNVRLPFAMYLHPQQLLLYPELIGAAVDAGIRSFSFGFQHASARIREGVFKRKSFCADYPRLARRIGEKSRNVNFHIIEAVPQESEADFLENIKFAANFPYDPARRRPVNFSVMLLNYIQGSALAQQDASLSQRPRDTRDWAYKSLLIEIRQLTDDDEFWDIYADERYRDDVVALRDLRFRLWNRRNNEYLLAESERLAGKKVYFWGTGDVYAARKHLFANSLPQAFLTDKKDMEIMQPGGLPIMATEFLAAVRDTPVVAFVPNALVMKLMREWEFAYPHIKDIVICTEETHP